MTCRPTARDVSALPKWKVCPACAFGPYLTPCIDTRPLFSCFLLHDFPLHGITAKRLDAPMIPAPQFPMSCLPTTTTTTTTENPP